jgi:hypothetical protein
MRAERSVLVQGFELACATKSRALREVRSRTGHREVRPARSLYRGAILCPDARRMVRTDGRSPTREHCPVLEIRGHREMNADPGIEADARRLDSSGVRAHFVATVAK